MHSVITGLIHDIFFIAATQDRRRVYRSNPGVLGNLDTRKVQTVHTQGAQGPTSHHQGRGWSHQVLNEPRRTYTEPS